MLTGESIPVSKGVDDDVITATVNLTSMIWIKATRVGSDTTLSRIIELVQAAQSGILIKGGGEAIEMAFRLDTIAFDKTGTLTYGKPKVVSAKFLRKGSNEQEARDLILQIIGTVESSSDHPLAKAVTQYTSK